MTDRPRGAASTPVTPVFVVIADRRVDDAPYDPRSLAPLLPRSRYTDGMKILAIESAGREGSVALMCDRTPTVHWLSGQRRHTAELLPLIETILGEASLRPRDLDLLAWSAGPGSFTGLRVGATVVRTLGEALACPVASISTLDVIAHNVLDASPPLEGRDHGPLIVMQDALGGQAYAAVYERAGDTLTLVRPAALVDPASLLVEVPGAAVLGTAVPRCGQACAEHAAVVLPEETWIASAGWVARLGRRMAEAGQTTPASAVLPQYLRRPSCEEVYDQKRAEAIARRQARSPGA